MRSQNDRATGKLNHVPFVSDQESFGFGVRVLKKGAWGFASSYRVTREEIVRAAREAAEVASASAALRSTPVELAPTPAYQDTYRTPLEKDPFQVPVEEKLDLWRRVNEAVIAVPKTFSAQSYLALRLERRFFASTEGSNIHQHITQVTADSRATAIEPGRKLKSRSYRPHPVTAGYEAVERAAFLREARRIGEEAVEAL